ncbi:hypothetical protein V866_005192 [Kwoniella sp. B9012]|uniref:Uncharacterized protein n=1 Tax=Kwoniella europaea PYCC6329 TaxID=1423913 RepID=A0AAX4KNA4_9TREE
MTHPNLTPPDTMNDTPSSPSPTRQDSTSGVDNNSTGSLPVSYSKSSELIGETRFLKYRPVPSKMQKRFGNSQGLLPSSSTFVPSSDSMDEYSNGVWNMMLKRADAWMRAVEHPTFPSEEDLKVIEGTKEAKVIRKKRALVGVIKDILEEDGVSIQDAVKTYRESSEENQDDWDWNLYSFAD